jgi:hypothetical protein
MRRCLLIVAALLLFAAGYYAGCRSVRIVEKTVVAYRDLPPVKVSVNPEAFRFTVPALPEWIWITDTVSVAQTVDTAAILADWILRRDYAGRLVSDATAVIDYSATVQYNRLQSLNLDYHPKQQVVTITRSVQRSFAPFLLVGANTAGHAQLQGGAFVGKWGFSVEVAVDFQGNYYYGGKIGRKFD